MSYPLRSQYRGCLISLRYRYLASKATWAAKGVVFMALMTLWFVLLEIQLPRGRIVLSDTVSLRCALRDDQSSFRDWHNHSGLCSRIDWCHRDVRSVTGRNFLESSASFKAEIYNSLRQLSTSRQAAIAAATNQGAWRQRRVL